MKLFGFNFPFPIKFNLINNICNVFNNIKETIYSFFDINTETKDKEYKEPKENINKEFINYQPNNENTSVDKIIGLGNQPVEINI